MHATPAHWSEMFHRSAVLNMSRQIGSAAGVAVQTGVALLAAGCLLAFGRRFYRSKATCPIGPGTLA